MTHTPQDAVRAAAKSLGGVVTVAEGLAGAGRSLDLDGLEREAAALCGAALMLPEEDGRAIRPDLALLLAQVDSLIVRLRR
ncbi:hypothetical protein ACE7GA_22640 [Roseomonas sp. CCTCC AB2023176]|uniref:hypothetical protein n=1 Tax=Roseomonas sp. CCTCC AB2023176 TaxID=3342640 RepID=UPI0035DC98EF